MAKEKACKYCKLIFEGDECPNCKRKDAVETFKGKIEIVDPEKSELSKHLKISNKGIYAIKL